MTTPEIETYEEVYYHGYVRTPRSRVVAAREEKLVNVPVPQSLERPKGYPAYQYVHKGQVQYPPPDGKLMSAGIDDYAPLDAPTAPNGQPWPAAPVTSGGTIRMSWWLTARHKTEKWHYYVTKDGWDQTKRLSRDMLEPLTTIHWHTDQSTAEWKSPFPINAVQHWIKLPKKQGRHIIYCVWDVGDTANAFYQGCDVEFVDQAVPVLTSTDIEFNHVGYDRG